MKRILWLLPFLPILFLFALVMPSAAQSATQEAAPVSTPLDWIPEDFSGFVTVDMSDNQATLRSLNVGLFTASVLQPTRIRYTQAQNFDPFLPLTAFDMENASFTQNVLPWLNNQVIIAYKNLGTDFNANATNTIMIFPATDSLEAANALNAVIKAQDFLKRETYHDVILYEGDKTSFAFLAAAVITGPTALLRETIDTMSGNGHALTADPVYQQVRAALP